MEDIIDIKGEDVILKRGADIVLQVKLSDFIRRVCLQQDICTFPDDSPMPDPVRFVQRKGNATVVVTELQPQVRQVRWIASSSPESFGSETSYDCVTLAFPYIVIIVLFTGTDLSGYQQLFYRSQEIASINDSLYFPNLLNVAEGYGLKCWLCLANIGSVSHLPWKGKVERIIEHLWEAGFNRSSEYHEGNSYWQKMLKANLDPRISSVESWQKATRDDPLFMLKISWRPAGVTIKEVVDSMLCIGSAASPIKTAMDLIPLICSCGSEANPLPFNPDQGSFMKQIKKYIKK